MSKCIKDKKTKNLYIFVFIPIIMFTATLGMMLTIPVFIEQENHHYHHLENNNNKNETYNILVIFDFKKILHSISTFNKYYKAINDKMKNTAFLKDMSLFSLHLNQSLLRFWDEKDDKDVNFCNNHYDNIITEQSQLYISRRRRVCCLLANIFHVEIQALDSYVNVFEMRGFDNLTHITSLKLLYMNQNKLILQYMMANMMDKVMNVLQTIKNGVNWTSTFSFYQLVSNRLMTEKGIRMSFSNDDNYDDDKNSSSNSRMMMRFSNFYQFNRQQTGGGGGKILKNNAHQRLFIKFIKVPLLFPDDYITTTTTTATTNQSTSSIMGEEE